MNSEILDKYSDVISFISENNGVFDANTGICHINFGVYQGMINEIKSLKHQQKENEEDYNSKFNTLSQKIDEIIAEGSKKSNRISERSERLRQKKREMIEKRLKLFEDRNEIKNKLKEAEDRIIFQKTEQKNMDKVMISLQKTEKKVKEPLIKLEEQKRKIRSELEKVQREIKEMRTRPIKQAPKRGQSNLSEKELTLFASDYRAKIKLWKCKLCGVRDCNMLFYECKHLGCCEQCYKSHKNDCAKAGRKNEENICPKCTKYSRDCITVILPD